MTALDVKFRHLTIVPGAATPLTIPALERLQALAINGDYHAVVAIVAVHRLSLPPYLTVLLGLPAGTPQEEVWDALRRARAHKMGLDESASLETVLAMECLHPLHTLRVEELKRQVFGLAPWSAADA